MQSTSVIITAEGHMSKKVLVSLNKKLGGKTLAIPQEETPLNIALFDYDLRSKTISPITGLGQKFPSWASEAKWKIRVSPSANPERAATQIMAYLKCLERGKKPWESRKSFFE